VGVDNSVIVNSMSLLQKYKTAGVWYSCVRIFTGAVRNSNRGLEALTKLLTFDVCGFGLTTKCSQLC